MNRYLIAAASLCVAAPAYAAPHCSKSFRTACATC